MTTPIAVQSCARKKLSTIRNLLFRLAVTASVCAIFTHTSQGQTSQHPTADLLSKLIQIDTSNPPGNESKIAEFLAAHLRPLGFVVQIVPTPEPGKAHFIARLKGDGSKKPVLLAAHADVVGVERESGRSIPSPAPFATATYMVAARSTSRVDWRYSLRPS